MPKTKIPLDLYIYREDLASLAPLYRAGNPLDDEHRRQLRKLCRAGLLYVSRTQQDIYTDYITQQLDFVLQDKNLTLKEVAAIFFKGFRNVINEFYKNPSRDLLDALGENCTVLMRFLTDHEAQTQELLKQFICYLHKHNNPGHQRANLVFVALTLYLTAFKNRINSTNLQGGLDFLLRP